MSSDYPILDPEAISGLRELSPGDDSFLKEIIEIFLEDTPARINDARSTLATGDTVAFIRAAHTIKGSCGNLGAERLRRTAERIEHDARKNGLVGLESAVAELEAEFAAARSALSALL
jgi:HPt (histidine-containing phosphotransfer) domain-containing protein